MASGDCILDVVLRESYLQPVLCSVELRLQPCQHRRKASSFQGCRLAVTTAVSQHSSYPLSELLLRDRHLPLRKHRCGQRRHDRVSVRGRPRWSGIRRRQYVLRPAGSLVLLLLHITDILHGPQSLRCVLLPVSQGSSNGEVSLRLLCSFS